MQKYRDCDFSFSGYKNFGRLIGRLESASGTPPDQPIAEAADIAASLQYLVALHIFKRLQRAVEFVERSRICSMDCREVTCETLMQRLSDCTLIDEGEGLHLPIVMSGGVACSDYFADCLTRFCSSYKSFYASTRLSPVIPRPKHMCSDNGIMIAWNAVLRLRSSDCSSSIDADKLLLQSDQEIQSLEVIPKSELGHSLREAVVAARIRSRPIHRSVFPHQHHQQQQQQQSPSPAQPLQQAVADEQG